MDANFKVSIPVILVLILGFTDPEGILRDLEITVLEPANKTGPDVALVIIPESYVNATQYTMMGKALQTEARSFRLWIGLIGGWDDQTPNLLQIRSGFEKILRRMDELGLTQPADVMVAGHGYGGGTLSDYVDLNPDMFEALILFSHLPPRDQKMTEFTLPTLFMSGDLDGLMTIFSAAQLFQRVVDQSEFAPDLVYNTPVVTLEGVNHTHYFSGEIPVNYTYADIDSDITYQQAWEDISHFVIAFIVVHAKQQMQEVNSSKALLRSAFDENKDRMGKIWAVQELDQNNDGHSPWTEQSQAAVVGLLPPQQKNLQISSDVVSELSLPGVKPKLALNGSVVSIEVYAEVTPPRGLDKVNATFSPLQIQAKMKRKTAVLALLPNATSEPYNVTCRDLNELAFQTAQNMASSTAQERFRTRGRKLMLNPDISVTTGFQWVTKQLELSYSQAGLNVTSYSLISPDDFIIKSIAGMHYCKLLSPSRALEWIYVDSLRGTKPVKP